MKRKVVDKLRHQTWVARNCKYLLGAEPPATPTPDPAAPWDDEEHPDSEFEPLPTQPTQPVPVTPEPLPPVRGRTQYAAVLDDANFSATPDAVALADAILAPPPPVDLEALQRDIAGPAAVNGAEKTEG